MVTERVINNTIQLSWNASKVTDYAQDDLCPVPRAALIGIPSVMSHPNSVRRRDLRKRYATLNAGLAESDKIDFRFVFGRTNEALHKRALAEGRDVILTDRVEGLTNGKIFDWIRAARNLSYAAHPTREGVYCRKYLYIGKSDDDSVIHVPRLSKLLTHLWENNEKGESLFVGRNWDRGGRHPALKHMTGMLYLTSLDVTEWLSVSKLPLVIRPKIGEDLQFSRWIIQGNLSVTWIDRDEFHNREADGEPVSFAHRPIGEDTIVVHHCKSHRHFFKCLLRMFGDTFRR
ncbi:hypothetical protein BC830DRAFT_1168976 [Chytriomyces sp. MP71]|nr:hypothetical protein BC830DRAFT_1170107 [Chytriomyces sp. MP71]KAI8614979.1 hypothetical protein BC830DRAFT_1168976 [Chytriomyces sp. MP71]